MFRPQDLFPLTDKEAGDCVADCSQSLNDPADQQEEKHRGVEGEQEDSSWMDEGKRGGGME